MADALELVVLGDSTAFTTDRGPSLPDDPVLYPNVVARCLEQTLGRPVHVHTIARPGTTVRELWRTLTKDRHVMFEVLPRADAVVVAVGSFDHAPAGVPAVVDAVVPHLRPTRLRRAVRRALHAAYPWLVRLTGARRRRTPPAEFRRLYDLCLTQVRALTGGAPGVVLGPTSHDSPYYGRRHPQHPAAEAEQLAIAAHHGFATVRCWELVAPHRHRLNPDGIHWPPEAHRAVGEALAAALLPQLRGEQPPPGVPGAPATRP